MRIVKLVKAVSLSLLFVFSGMSTACKKEGTWKVIIGPGGQRRLECSVTISNKFVADVQNEVNNFVDVDIEDMANPWQPDPTSSSQMTIIVTTDTGSTTSATFNTAYDPVRSSQYQPFDTETTPRAYLPVDQAAVQNFMNAAVANASSTVSVTIDGYVTARLVNPDITPSGCYTNHKRDQNSGGIDFDGTYSFNYVSPADGGEKCNGRLCPILQ